MADTKDTKKESVKSPCNSMEGLIANAGGMPPKWTPEKVFEENQPPTTPAKNSTEGRGSK